ncbi:hypothetical protein B0H34DRAFT_793164 [Crassisporium funariophilum]|nr:hypothetical protein B0H34DRAFT_793164 [Crassisporium funariophilum]
MDWKLRFLYATIAAGMGMDISDIEMAVTFGVDNFNSYFQKGGRAGRNPNLKAKMIWIVEPWAFEAPPAEQGKQIEGKQPSKKSLAEAKRRDNMDPASRKYINRSESEKCMQEYAVTHFRPKPNLPGFPGFEMLDQDWEGELPNVTWEVMDQEITVGVDCGCSSQVCRANPQERVGQLSDAE